MPLSFLDWVSLLGIRWNSWAIDSGRWSKRQNKLLNWVMVEWMWPSRRKAHLLKRKSREQGSTSMCRVLSSKLDFGIPSSAASQVGSPDSRNAPDNFSYKWVLLTFFKELLRPRECIGMPDFACKGILISKAFPGSLLLALSGCVTLTILKA